MDPRSRRVIKELAEIEKDKSSEINIRRVDDDMFHLVATIRGPEGSPYEEGHFDVDVVVPPTYPFQALKMKFLTPIYHPNCSSQTGAICLDILKDAWSPVLSIKTTLISLRSLLVSAEPDDPQDAQVAAHMKRDPADFERTARAWTRRHALRDGGQQQRGGGGGGGDGASDGIRASSAGGAGTEPSDGGGGVEADEVRSAGLDESDVQRFEQMGFARRKVIDALVGLGYGRGRGGGAGRGAGRGARSAAGTGTGTGTGAGEVSDEAVLNALLEGAS